MSLLSLLLVLVMAAFVAADVDYMEEYAKEINNELQLLQRDGSLWCPDAYIGHICPEAGLFFRYKCCGKRSKDCCQTAQPWVEAIASLIGALFVLTACCCCICLCAACNR